MKWKALLRSRLFWAGLLVGFSLPVYLATLYLNDNFHEVIPYQLYRSGQPEKGELLGYARKYGIRSVLNLRGENTGMPWYDDEVRDAKLAGLTHLDFRISSKYPLTERQIADLVAVMQQAPKPLLIHCEGGADRTGLAAALYMKAMKEELQITSEADDPIERQLSLEYGHLPSFQTDAMCKTLENKKSVFN